MIVRFRSGNMTETRPVHEKLDHHVSAARKRDGYKQLPVNSSSFNFLIELQAASILIFYWNINLTANAPSSFWIVERSPDHPASNMVSFRGQKKLWPRPDRSPLGV